MRDPHRMAKLNDLTIEDYQQSIDDIANQLCKAVDGNFDFIVKTTTKDETIQKLGMLINFVLDASSRSGKEIQRNQLQLAHYSRLTTAGEMASAYAHELNQPLSAIIQYIGGCLEHLKKGSISDDVITAMEAAIEQAQRAGAIIHSLKDFLGKRQINKELINVNNTIGKSIKLFEAEIARHHILLDLKLTENLPFIYADQIQIEQVILNIAYNAIEAMKDHLSKQKQLTFQTSVDLNQSIQIIIADTGPGITAEVMQEIFNPFFTTKLEGMGMGLAISRSIIEAHQGKITVGSSMQTGTYFCISLPQATQQ